MLAWFHVVDEVAKLFHSFLEKYVAKCPAVDQESVDCNPYYLSLDYEWVDIWVDHSGLILFAK